MENFAELMQRLLCLVNLRTRWLRKIEWGAALPVVCPPDT